MKLEGSIEKPLNREPSVEALAARYALLLAAYLICLLTHLSFITGKGNYDRNHCPISHLDGKTHVVQVDGNVKKPLRGSLSRIFRQGTRSMKSPVFFNALRTGVIPCGRY